MSDLKKKIEQILPAKLFRFMLQVYRLRLCFKNFLKPIGTYITLKLLILEYLKSNKLVFLRKQELFVKCNYFTLTTLMEIYNRRLYEQVEGLNCVLDAGSFIGESSIYLLKNNNKKIVSVEPSKEKYELLKKNISKNKSTIIGYNRALVNSNSETIELYSADLFDFCSSTIKKKNLTITEEAKTIHIKDLIKKYPFDGLKMDIEGGEFEIIEFFLNNKKKFKFSKGIIEFHFSKDYQKRKKIFDSFFKFLKKENYSITFFDNYNKEISFEKIQGEKILCFNLFFRK